MDGDKEKSGIEKMIDKINDAVESIVNIAAEAAIKALEPDTPKNTEQPIASFPQAADGLLSDPLVMPPAATAPAARKQAAPTKAPGKSVNLAGITARKPPKKSAAGKSNKKSNKASKKSAKRTARKGTATKKIAKKAAGKSVNKASKRNAKSTR